MTPETLKQWRADRGLTQDAGGGWYVKVHKRYPCCGCPVAPHEPPTPPDGPRRPPEGPRRLPPTSPEIHYLAKLPGPSNSPVPAPLCPILAPNGQFCDILRFWWVFAGIGSVDMQTVPRCSLQTSLA